MERERIGELMIWKFLLKRNVYHCGLRYWGKAGGKDVEVVQEVPELDPELGF